MPEKDYHLIANFLAKSLVKHYRVLDNGGLMVVSADGVRLSFTPAEVAEVRLFPTDAILNGGGAKHPAEAEFSPGCSQVFDNKRSIPIPQPDILIQPNPTAVSHKPNAKPKRPQAKKP